MTGNDRTKAVALVYDDEYQSTRESITQAIADFRQSLDTRLTAQAEELSYRSRVAGYVGLGAIVISGGAIVGSLLGFYRSAFVNPVAELNQSLRDLLDHKSGVSIGYQKEDSEVGEVARSLESYRRAADEVETQRWIKSHAAETSGLLQRAEAPQEFGGVIQARAARRGGVLTGSRLWVLLTGHVVRARRSG